MRPRRVRSVSPAAELVPSEASLSIPRLPESSLATVPNRPRGEHVRDARRDGEAPRVGRLTGLC